MTSEKSISDGGWKMRKTTRDYNDDSEFMALSALPALLTPWAVVALIWWLAVVWAAFR